MANGSYTSDRLLQGVRAVAILGMQPVAVLRSMMAT
jgi:hypothetical protein